MQEFTHEYAYHWFHTPTALEKAGGLWPIRAGKNLAKPHYKIGPRMITYFSIHFVLEGEGTFTFGDNSVSISKGDSFCLFPNQTHTYKTCSENPLQMVWLAFDGKQAKSILQNIGVTPSSPVVFDVVDEKVKEFLLEFIDLTSEWTVLTRLSKMYELFSLLSFRASKLSSKENWLKKSTEFIETHFGEGITVEDVANYVGLHRSYLTSQFTEQLGYSPKKYIVSLKMKHAAKMIEEKNIILQRLLIHWDTPTSIPFQKHLKITSESLQETQD